MKKKKIRKRKKYIPFGVKKNKLRVTDGVNYPVTTSKYDENGNLLWQKTSIPKRKSRILKKNKLKEAK
ncbi:hypothetical protein H9635_07695 [Solibacillus sp. A46]|uniref:Uncharacterized protein n=1 Tax=Solibacillus faecavium TaxID=2762221 RepID=A0ABR8XXE8_9BACL|nr:hypothetical protein [Solibacillus faecavium]MBD8036621.1 hypothetical protein [Solibacillus faecavium]